MLLIYTRKGILPKKVVAKGRERGSLAELETGDRAGVSAFKN
jgi:hypothetical protein